MNEYIRGWRETQKIIKNTRLFSHRHHQRRVFAFIMLLYRFLIGRRFVSSEFRNKIEFNTMGFEAMDFVVRHSSSAKTNVTPKNDCSSYEKAINALNNLLPNSTFLQNSVVTQQRGTESLNLADTEKYLVRAGMTIKDLEKLKVIHVSGTKGKGSTCALVESILRSHGLRTGFYSSPHLVSVTERIRLGGLPISKESFAKYFWTVHRKLEAAAVSFAFCGAQKSIL